MSYWIFPASGMIVSRTTLQRVTYIETCTDARKQRFEVYDNDIKEIPHKKYSEEAFAGTNITKPTMEILDELAEYDKDFQSEFNEVFDNPTIKEADKEFAPDLYDKYDNIKLTLQRGVDKPEFARVKKRLKESNGRPIVVANDNPILDLIITPA